MAQIELCTRPEEYSLSVYATPNHLYEEWPKFAPEAVGVPQMPT
jgi:hypothetical protein